jgi:hypothetical protein
MLTLICIILSVAVFQTALALAATFNSIFGDTGRRWAMACTKAPMIDLMLGLFTWIPWIILGIAFGWRGVIGSIIGQVIGLFIWITGHEMANREAAAGPRIVKTLNRTVGRWQNHLALWVTAVAFPGFLFIRLMEVALWPALVALLRFPKYDQAKWVNITRQKFSGLIGHDLIWCLYCDWMTGVYSLGAEMLRSVESFWCPIRFYDGKKCDNCKLDFPDIDGGWVAADGTMQQVTETLEGMYGGTGERAWFGHPVRMTVNGKSI